MNGNYLRGYRVERRAKERLEKLGYLVVRSAGSHSPVDMVGIGVNDIKLVQCKSMQFGKPYNPRAELTALSALTAPQNASIELWVYEQRKGWHDYYARLAVKEGQ